MPCSLTELLRDGCMEVEMLHAIDPAVDVHQHVVGVELSTHLPQAGVAKSAEVNAVENIAICPGA